jgi:predicted DNA-binding protein (UPF0251 family)
MPRPRKHRCCRRYHADRIYKPQGIPLREIGVIHISLDEFEAMRLCDYEGLEQTDAGERMGVSRGTVQRLLYSARHKVVEAMLNENAIAVNLQESEESNVGMYPHQGQRGCRRCRV